MNTPAHPSSRARTKIVVLGVASVVLGAIGPIALKILEESSFAVHSIPEQDAIHALVNSWVLPICGISCWAPWIFASSLVWALKKQPGAQSTRWQWGALASVLSTGAAAYLFDLHSHVSQNYLDNPWDHSFQVQRLAYGLGPPLWAAVLWRSAPSFARGALLSYLILWATLAALVVVFFAFFIHYGPSG